VLKNFEYPLPTLRLDLCAKKRFRTGFGDLFGHAKPCLNCRLPVPARQGALRLRALTRLNQRAQSQKEARLFEAVKDGEATTKWRAASFTASNRHFTIDRRFVCSIACTKARPKQKTLCKQAVNRKPYRTTQRSAAEDCRAPNFQALLELNKERNLVI
jgi:hypothetical protein